MASQLQEEMSHGSFYPAKVLWVPSPHWEKQSKPPGERHLRQRGRWPDFFRGEPLFYLFCKPVDRDPAFWPGNLPDQWGRETPWSQMAGRCSERGARSSVNLIFLTGLPFFYEFWTSKQGMLTSTTTMERPHVQAWLSWSERGTVNP